MRLKKVLDNCGKVFSVTVGILSMDGYFRNINDTTLKYRLLEEQDKNQRLSLEIQELSKFENKLEVADVKFNILDADLNEFSNNVTHESNFIKEINSKLKNPDLNQNDLSVLNNDLVHHVENINNELKLSNNILTDIKDLIEKLIGGGSDSNSNFINYKIELNNFLSTLSTQQLGALGHLSLSIFILLCIISVITIIYGDYLIRYLKLEEKFPKIARFIQLRRKFEHFYLLLNLSLIIIILLYIIYINLTILYILR
jgi:hypothetical protein